MPHHYGVARSTDMSVRMMITMELPLFSGGATLAAIKQKAAHRTISELNLSMKPSEKMLLSNGLTQQINDLLAIKMSAERALASAALTNQSATRTAEAGEFSDAGRELINA